MSKRKERENRIKEKYEENENRGGEREGGKKAGARETARSLRRSSDTPPAGQRSV